MRPSYEDGHLVVAAARVLARRANKPPTPEQIAELLGLPPDFVGTLVVMLGEEGILMVVENPFEIHVEVADYVKLEDLPREANGPTMRDELNTFIQKKHEEYVATEKMLSLDEVEKKQKAKMSKLEEEMKKMKGPNSLPSD
jgi:hypothetical protein